MQTFLTRTSIFFALGFCIIFGYHYAIYQLLLSDTDHYVIKGNISTIVIGDSHTETSIDETHFTGLKNYSYKGESIFLIYYKLQKLLQTNSNIDEVLLSFSYHSLNDFQDTKLQALYYEYYWLLDKEGYTQVNITLDNLSIALKDMSGRLYQWLIAHIKNNSFHLLTGGYRGLDMRNLNEDSSHKRILKHYYESDEITTQKYSAVQEQYLDKIIQLCLDKNISLTFINTPLHQSYLDNIPQRYIDEYYSHIETLRTAHQNNIKLLDYKDAVTDDGLFHDGDHLTIEGGKRFMDLLKRDLSS